MIALLIAASLAQAPLQPWSAFIGHCWSGPAPGRGVDTHCFESVYGGQHVRDRHEVKVDGRPVYAGETVYSLDGNSAVFTYFNSLGGIGRGTVEPGGSTLHFKGSMRASPDKSPQQIDSEWRVVDEDHYDVHSLVKSASTAGNAVLHFRRVK